MPAIVDSDLLNQLDADPSDARPLTITPQGAPAPQSGPVTDPALLSALDSAPPDPSPAQPSTAFDMLKGAGTGLVRGVAAIPGMVGDVSNGIDYATSWAIAKAAEKMGLLPEGKTANDFINDVQGMNLPAPNFTPSAPTTSDIVGNIEKVAGPLPKPQTTAGQITENVASFLPQSVLAPGNAVCNALAYGVAPGVASEAAGRAANSMLGGWADPWARGIGAAVGGGIGHLGAAPAPIENLVSSATRGVSDADMQSARQLQQSAAAQGIQITPAEAIQHVTGGRSNLGNLQRNIEGMAESAPIMADYFAQRPQQVRQAAGQVFDQIAPRPADPYQTGVAAQNEAEGAMANIRQDRSNATSRYYGAAAGDQVAPDRMQAVAQQLDALAAQNPNNPALTAPLSDLRRQIVATPGAPGRPAVPGQRVPVTDPRTGAVIRYDTTPGTPAVPPLPESYITDVGQLDKIYGGLRDQYTGPAPLGQSGTDARAGRIAAQGLGYLNNELTAASPALAAGRQAHGIMTERWVAPREAGPIGQITRTNDLQAQGNALYPSNPSIGSEGQTAEAVGRLASTAPAITRNHLETRFNEATQNNMPGPNQWGGAKFAARAAGNAQQATNLEAGLAALPNGAQVTPRYQALMDALSATGQRQHQGSKTAFNDQFHTSMEAGSPFGSLASLAASPEKALGYARDRYQQYRIGSNALSLADLLVARDGMNRIEAARAAVAPDQVRSALIQTMMARAGMTVPVAAQNRTGSAP